MLKWCPFLKVGRMVGPRSHPSLYNCFTSGHMSRPKHGEGFAWPEGRGEGSQTDEFQVVKNKVAWISRNGDRVMAPRSGRSDLKCRRETCDRVCSQSSIVMIP